MNILDGMVQSGAIANMAKQLGVDEGTAQAGAQALLPAVLGGFKRQTQADGLGGLGGLLSQLGGGGLLDNVLTPGDSSIEQGNQVLGSIFGSKEVSRTVAAGAQQQTGIGADLLKKMLPIVAMTATGMMSKQAEAPAGADTDSAGLGGIIGGIIGGLSGGPGEKSGLGAVANLLDLDGDGNPLDDIIGMAGKLGR